MTLFIDTINNALENEYLSLKEVRYHDFWKLSITYTEFEEDRLSYALVPIRWGENDLLIREAIGLNPFNDFSSASTMFGHYRDNPIKSRPVAYANELLSKQLIEILKDRSLILYTEQLAKECITDFFDYYGRILPIKFDTSVSIAEYLNVAERYLPVWFEEYNKLHHMPIIDCKLLIDVEKLRWHLHPEDVRYITTRVRQRLAKGDDKAPLIKEVGKDMRYHNLLTSLHILKDLGYTNLARPFKAKGQHGDSGLIFDFHTPNSAFEKLKFVYESLPVVYDTFIKEFFPKLFDDLKFYSSCDLVIVNVKYGKIHGSDQESPEIELFYLKSNLSVTPQLKIYLNSQGCPIARENSFIYFDEDITIDGVQYRLNMSSGQDIYKLYDEFTLREIMYELILDKFTRYFKSKTG